MEMPRGIPLSLAGERPVQWAFLQSRSSLNVCIHGERGIPTAISLHKIDLADSGLSLPRHLKSQLTVTRFGAGRMLRLQNLIIELSITAFKTNQKGYKPKFGIKN